MKSPAVSGGLNRYTHEVLRSPAFARQGLSQYLSVKEYGVIFTREVLIVSAV
jgi:hypothetical protein